MLSQRKFQPILDNLLSYSGVKSVVVANEEGFPLAYQSKDSSFSSEDAEIIAAVFASLVGKAVNATKQIDKGDLNFFTLDLTTGEVLVALEHDYIVIALRERPNKGARSISG